MTQNKRQINSLAVIILCASTLTRTCYATDTQPTTDDHLLAEFLNDNKEIHRSRSAWRLVQEAARDTVVQIFSQIAECDMLQPYKTPQQYSARGSGFFINEEGYLITNAHVVNQALTIWIQIPSMGKRFITVDLIGVCPERDIALLRVSEKDRALIRYQLGVIPYLMLGDSDSVRPTDEVLALGYPLGQEALKSTTGVISGRERSMIQMDAAINPGSSGGPLLNHKGEVVGINSAGIVEAQNVGYVIPINELHVIIDDLYSVFLVRKPFLGIISIKATESLTDYLGNPQPGGCYIVEVVKDSLVYKAGIDAGDMLYSINGYDLDIYGEMSVPWSENKISILDYILRLKIGEQVNFVGYRKGERYEASTTFDRTDLLPIRKVYPGYEAIDYTVFAGMVVMELTLNHVHLLAERAPGLARYTEMGKQAEPALVITHIFANSQLSRSRTLTPGMTLKEVNGIPVRTLSELNQAFKKSLETRYFTIKAYDNVSRVSENIFVVLPFDKIIEEEPQLAQGYHYPLSDNVKEICGL